MGFLQKLLLHGGTTLHSFLFEIITLIWENAVVPNSWKDAIIITIYKNKGDKAICGNSRGIALLSTAGKVLAKILLKRLITTISEAILPESQCGFRSNRSTIDMIFSARQLLEKSREQHRNLYVAFIDLSKAFDSVDRTLLWLILEKSGCPHHFVQIVRCLHDGMTACIRVGDDTSDPFEVTRGVKQGCVLAPVLFNTYVRCITVLLAQTLDKEHQITLNYRVDRNLFDSKKMKARSKISQTKLLELQYADDCAMVADSPEFLQIALSHTSKFYQKLGLKINIGKTELIQYRLTSSENPATLQIDNVPLQNVETFKYLGSYIAASCHLDDKINYRIRQASRAYGRLRNRVFHNKNITLSTKVMVYNAIVLSSLLYSSETWALYSHQTRRLESFHMSSLRKLLGVSWRDKVPDTEVLLRTKSVSVDTILCRNHLRWLGHVIRMSDTRLPKQFLFGELSKGSRTVGRQRKRFKDQASGVLRSCHIPLGQLKALASDRKKWRSACKEGLQLKEKERLKKLEDRRSKRQEKRSTPTTVGPPQHFCPDCGRGCMSQIGLISHLRTHRDKKRRKNVQH